MEFFNLVSDIEGERLDMFLSKNMEGFSRSRLQSLIKDGAIQVNNKKVKPSYKLCLNDVIEGQMPELTEIDIKPVDIPLDIVYEDSHIIVINKPKNMVVHPAPGHFEDTLVNALLFHCKSELSGINGALRPGIVHRIDKDTTGLLVVAKTNDAHMFLSNELQNHNIQRTYEAIVFGNMKTDEGIIDEPIGRHQTDRLRMCVTNKNGRKAITHYKVLKHFNKYTFIEAKLETGRTHQIRVHLAHIGYPVLGDTLYTKRKQPFNTNGQVLHAKRLTFIHPFTKETVSFESELPDYFNKLLNIME